MSQLLGILDQVDIDEIGAKEQIMRGIAKYRRLSHGVLGRENKLDKGPKVALLKGKASLQATQIPTGSVSWTTLEPILSKRADTFIFQTSPKNRKPTEADFPRVGVSDWRAKARDSVCHR